MNDLFPVVNRNAGSHLAIDGACLPDGSHPAGSSLTTIGTDRARLPRPARVPHRKPWVTRHAKCAGCLLRPHALRSIHPRAFADPGAVRPVPLVLQDGIEAAGGTLRVLSLLQRRAFERDHASGKEASLDLPAPQLSFRFQRR